MFFRHPIHPLSLVELWCCSTGRSSGSSVIAQPLLPSFPVACGRTLLIQRRDRVGFSPTSLFEHLCSSSDLLRYLYKYYVVLILIISLYYNVSYFNKIFLFLNHNSRLYTPAPNQCLLQYPDDIDNFFHRSRFFQLINAFGKA